MMKTQLDSEDFKLEGNDAFGKKQFSKALVCYTRAIELNPTDETLYSNRSATYLKLKNYSQALIDAQKCVELKEDWFKGHFRMGLVYLETGKYQEACVALEKALKCEPTNEEITAKLELAKKSVKQ